MTPIEITTQLLHVLAAVAVAPLFAGWIGKCRAWLQNRRAPGLLLPYRGIRKLFHKDAAIAEGASPLFRMTPYVVFGTMVLAAAIIPSLGTRLPFTHAADAIALVGLFATARAFMALAAMDVGTAFGSMGARREMLIACLAEPALLMVFFTPALLAQSTALTTIVEVLVRQTLTIPVDRYELTCADGSVMVTYTFPAGVPHYLRQRAYELAMARLKADWPDASQVYVATSGQGYCVRRPAHLVPCTCLAEKDNPTC